MDLFHGRAYRTWRATRSSRSRRSVGVTSCTFRPAKWHHSSRKSCQQSAPSSATCSHSKCTLFMRPSGTWSVPRMKNSSRNRSLSATCCCPTRSVKRWKLLSWETAVCWKWLEIASRITVRQKLWIQLMVLSLFRWQMLKMNHSVGCVISFFIFLSLAQKYHNSSVVS